MSLPELLTVTVISIVVLGGILLSLDVGTKVSARATARAVDLRSANSALATFARDARGAYVVAPVDPLQPTANVDGLSLLVQSGTTAGTAGGASERDARVWITYRCTTSESSRSCTRTVNAAESTTSANDGDLPAMLVDGGRFVRGAQIGATSTIVTDLTSGSGADPVFSLGWSADADTSGACADSTAGSDCTVWRTPAMLPASSVDARGLFLRGTGDIRAPALRMTLQVRSRSDTGPTVLSTALVPRGCLDATVPAGTSTAQIDC